jgi:NADH-quinone oxidoreductase subunit E
MERARIVIREGKRMELTLQVLDRVKALIDRYPEGKQKSALVPVLLIFQEEQGGFLSVESMDYAADLLKLNPIEVYEVATFYSMFHPENTGRYIIEVCRTGPCAMCGGEEILSYLQQKLEIGPGETTPDGLFTLKTVECLGACGNAPVLQVNTRFHENLTCEKVDQLLERCRTAGESSIPFEETWAGKFC